MVFLLFASRHRWPSAMRSKLLICACSSLDRVAAVDGKRLPGNPACGITTEEQSGTSDIGWLSMPPQRDASQHRLGQCRIGEKTARHAAAGGADGERIYAGPVPGKGN